MDPIKGFLEGCERMGKYIYLGFLLFESTLDYQTTFFWCPIHVFLNADCVPWYLFLILSLHRNGWHRVVFINMANKCKPVYSDLLFVIDPAKEHLLLEVLYPRGAWQPLTTWLLFLVDPYRRDLQFDGYSELQSWENLRGRILCYFSLLSEN